MTWPRLSQSLTGPQSPENCQNCGASESLSVWREHDELDKPESIYVVLCRRCADRLIEPHPRLYAAMPVDAPIAGVMALCVDCKHRDGTRCGCPDALANGGRGIAITSPRPTLVHFYRRGKGAKSGWEKLYPGPPKSCTGHESAIKGRVVDAPHQL